MIRFLGKADTVLARFFSYTELRTKITSIFAFLMSLAYLFSVGQSLDARATLVFFASMILFDLATTAINNYIDTKTNGEVLPFERRKALGILLVLLLISASLGLYLVYLTDLLVLFMGGLCFLCGIFYTFGPVPISRIPLGEVLSGLFYGLFIPFLVLYINMPEGTYAEMELSLETVGIRIHVFPCFTVLLLAAAPFLTTANIMLANNICDLKKDILVGRHTLPYYLQSRAIDLFAWIYYAVYPVTLLLAGLSILHPICLLLLLTFFPVRKNIRQFRSLQDKRITFPLSIKNYLLIMGTNTLLIWLSGIL